MDLEYMYATLIQSHVQSVSVLYKFNPEILLNIGKQTSP